MDLLLSLKRGALSGAVGGLLLGGFGLLLAEPIMDRAVDLEAARSAAAGDVGEETFTRATQHFGLPVSALLVGVSIGVLYAVVHALLHRDDTSDPWGKALRLGAGGFFAVALVPFLRYPPSPPGVGDSDTIGTRTNLFVLAIVIGLVGSIAAGLMARGLAERGVRPSLRQLAVLGVLIATVALTFVMPSNTDEINAPVTLVWEFRMLSLASLALLWGGLAVTFGLLSERDSTPAATPAQDVPAHV